MNIYGTLRHWFGEGVFRRIFKNAGLMLSGRAATGLLSLGTLTLSARGLGVEQFGVLVLVQTYAQLITSVGTFESCQAVIRYGAMSLQRDHKVSFQSLVKFLTLLDIGGGLAGALIGYFAAPLVGPYVGWSDEVISYAQPYSVLILFTACATPTGLLRLFDRFDLLAVQTTITPLFRLIGVAIATIMDAPIWAYLLAWVVAQVIGGVTLTYLGWREAYRRAWLADFNFSLKELRHHHDGLLRFAILSNLYMALQIIIAQMSTFLVGFLAGPSAAGIFKIGREASTVLSKPAELLNQSIYPEFARLGSTGHWHAFTRLILRGGAVAAGVGVFMLALVIAFGSPALETFFGEAFGAAYIPLILMVAAATLAIIGFPMDAALFAMGHAGLPLRVSAGVTLLIHLPLLFFLGRLYGPVGAALAIFAASAATLAIMTTLTAIYLRRHTTQTDGPRPILEPHKFV